MTALSTIVLEVLAPAWREGRRRVTIRNGHEDLLIKFRGMTLHWLECQSVLMKV